MRQRRLEELYYEYCAPAHGIHSWQYVYEIGSYHYNWHPAAELLLVLTGEVEVCTGGSVILLGQGDLILINSGEGHATLAKAPRSTVLLLHVDQSYVGSFVDGVAYFDCSSTPLTSANPVFTELRQILAQMMLSTPADRPASAAGYEAGLARIVQILLTHFMRETDRSGCVDPIGTNSVIAQATVYIDRHFAERITLKRLGEIAGYSPTYISQIFSQTLGMTTSEYIRRVRLAHAVIDLNEQDKRIADVALANGFPDVKAFNSAFQNAFGKTPSQYRQHVAGMGRQIRQVDESFHQHFVPRSDEEIVSILRAFAGSGGDSLHHPDSSAVTAPGRSAQRSLSDSISLARELLENLDRLTGTQPS
ncbi:MAG: AraC family transcriptional regulator [Ancrocorticia sp.]|uniref:AraC family transcriptional regulator n=1 Tax=Ancrocorticia sp. TaxID=2593684 RepID=UPI003F8FFE80